MDNLFANLPKVRGKYRYNEPLKKYTWLNVGGNADVMFFPKDETDLQIFLGEKSKKIPFFILGNGSNLLIRDGGIEGVVIKLNSVNFSQWKCEGDKLILGCGFKNALLKNILLENGLGGLEFLCSIPGCLGGAVRSNAGCFGSEISQVLLNAKVMDGNGNIFDVNVEDFHFSYRNSDFPQDWVILQVGLQTHSATRKQIEDILIKNALYRKEHQPQNIRTAGSTFKNPQQNAAWKLIKESGACNLKVGGASFSEKHCNFLVNDGTATAEDLEKLGENARKLVFQKFGINLEWEIKLIGRENGCNGK